MNKVIVDMDILDEDDPALKDFGDGAEASPWTPRQIADALLELDPDDLRDTLAALALPMAERMPARGLHSMPTGDRV